MADTIISNTPSRDDGGLAGWIVALVVILAMAIGALVLYQNGFFAPNPSETNGSTNINVTLPDPITTPSETAQ